MFISVNFITFYLTAGENHYGKNIKEKKTRQQCVAGSESITER